MKIRMPFAAPWLIALVCGPGAGLDCLARAQPGAQPREGRPGQQDTRTLDDDGEPPAINPFGPREQSLPDAQPGFAELSDGQLLIGQLYLTRDTRLKVFDWKLGRQREIPWTAIARIDSHVQREWLERQWRFKENANDEKVYTGHSYPSRELDYEITLRDGRTIRGPVSGILYIQSDPKQPARHVLLNKRQKGELDQPLGKLVYLRRVRLGEQAVSEARQQVERQVEQQVERRDGRQESQPAGRREGQPGVVPESDIR